MPYSPKAFDGFCGPTYLAASPVVDASRSINLYPDPGYAASKTKMALIGRPGLSPSPFVTLAQSPVRALWAGSNRLFAVAGTHFYELSSIGGVLHDYGAMTGSTGQGPAYISANGTQLLVCDPPANRVFNANPGTFTMDQVFTGSALDYLDGFYISIAQGAALAGSNPNQVNVSNLGDGTAWNALNYVIRTGAADQVNQIAVLNGQLWIFGQKSIEVWYNAGNPLFPFARIQGATINLGLMAAASVVKFYNTLMWLGADDRGYPQVYMTKGLSPVRVSNAGIESLLSIESAANLPLAWAYGYQEAGHTFYVLNTVTQSYVPVQQYVYDLNTGLWHERVYGIGAPWPVCFASVPGFNSTGPNFVGDGKSGKVMFQGIIYPNDGGIAIGYIRTAPHISGSNRWIKHRYFELDGDFGTATPTLDYSDDGGRTFGGRARALQQAADQGRGSPSPAFRRFFANQLGRSRDRVYKVSITDSANLIRIANAYVDAG